MWDRDSAARLVEAFSHLEGPLREAATENRKASAEAIQEHPVEAAMLAHIAGCSERVVDVVCALTAAAEVTVEALNEITRLLAEPNLLAAWLPNPEEFRRLNPKLQKAELVHFILSLPTDEANRNKLISEATETSGRPSGTRAVAVRALEMQLRGLSLKEIEEQLLPHRRGVRNPGETIRREIYALKRVLESVGINVHQF